MLFCCNWRHTLAACQLIAFRLTVNQVQSLNTFHRNKSMKVINSKSFNLYRNCNAQLFSSINNRMVKSSSHNV